MTFKHAPARPWYREPFVWLLIAIPLTAVIVGFVGLALAIRSDDGMVEDDYYRQGMAINRMLDRDKAAAAENLTDIGAGSHRQASDSYRVGGHVNANLRQRIVG